MNPLDCAAKVPPGPADNNETFDIERRVEVISPGTAGGFWEVSASFPASVRIVWDNHREPGFEELELRNQPCWKGQTGELLFSFSKKKGSAGIT